jgi:hypothetical protein
MRVSFSARLARNNERASDILQKAGRGGGCGGQGQNRMSRGGLRALSVVFGQTLSLFLQFVPLTPFPINENTSHS